MIKFKFNKKVSSQFCIKGGYISNLNPIYYTDNTQKYIYQPDVYELVYYLAHQSAAKTIIDIGSGNGEKLKKFQDQFNLICADFGENQSLIKNALDKFTFVNVNLENGLNQIFNEELNDSVVIFSDVIEHIINPEKVLKDLSEISKKCKYLIISTPDRARARGIEDFGPPANRCHVREWNIEEFDQLLKAYNFSNFMIGHTVNTDFHLHKNNIIAIAGSEIYKQSNEKKTVLAIINAFNEGDIIKDVAEHLLCQGVDGKVVDNWSTDNTVEIIEELRKSYGERVTLEKFPVEKNDKYEWEKQLINTAKLAKESNYDWIIHHDADEIRETPWEGVSIVDAISFIDAAGYNAIDFTVIDFRPIHSRFEFKSAIENNRFFEFGKRPGHFLQVKGWKNQKNLDIDLASTGGHEVKFVNKKVYPIKFLLKHYSLRSKEQASKKIFQERLNRFTEYEKVQKGWHTQYDKYTTSDQFEWDPSQLINWNRKYFDMEYIVERISGIGINRDY